jgi:hypothetical protein
VHRSRHFDYVPDSGSFIFTIAPARSFLISRQTISAMKTLRVLFLVFFATAFAGFISAADKPAKAKTPVRLQVAVTVPATMSVIYASDVEEAFGYRVSSALHEQGFQGRIKYLDDDSDAKPDIPKLAINLIQWRVGRTGDVDCVFSASLVTTAGTKNLGLFTGSSMLMWSRPNWLERSEGFEDAASDALSNLAKKIEATGLLPKVPVK